MKELRRRAQAHARQIVATALGEPGRFAPRHPTAHRPLQTVPDVIDRLEEQADVLRAADGAALVPKARALGYPGGASPPRHRDRPDRRPHRDLGSLRELAS
jgi:hypothetical protein